MAQQLREPVQSTFDGSREWLRGLVETFDSTERLRGVPCEASALRAMRAQLARPISAPVLSTALRYNADRRYSPASCSRGS